jgi:hypothetical protein
MIHWFVHLLYTHFTHLIKMTKRSKTKTILGFKSNEFYPKKTFLTIFSEKKTFSSISFRSNYFSVRWLLYYFRSNDKTNYRSNDLSVVWSFIELIFRSNGVRLMGIWLNAVTVKRRTVNLGSDEWCHGQKAFRSNGILPNCVKQTGSSVVWLGDFWEINWPKSGHRFLFNLVYRFTEF